MSTQLRTHLTEKEVNRLIDAAPTLRDKITIRFLFRTGCRVSELCTIRTADVDLKEGLVLIKHLKRVAKLTCTFCGNKSGRTSKFCPKCGKSLEGAEQTGSDVNRQRLLPIDRETCKLIASYLKQRKTESDRLMPLSRQGIDKTIKDAVSLAGLDDIILRHPESGKEHKISAHKLRDAFTIRALELDDSVESQIHLQQQLGHKSFSTTARYAKFELKDSRDWYDRLWKGKDK